jgi:hypothetical protein
MSYLVKAAVAGVLAAGWVGVVGCEHEHGHGHRDKIIVVPEEKHETRGYTHERSEKREIRRQEHHERD